MQNLESLGLLGLGARLKRISELLFRQCDDFYKSRDIKLQARNFPLLKLLATHDTLSVTVLADMLGQTHPAISQMTKKLEQQGWLYHEMDSKDERRRLIALTPQGYEIVDQLKPLWKLFESTLNRILEVSTYGLVENLELLERELDKTPLKDRIEHLERQEKSDRVEIVHFKPNYAEDFYRLNRSWLDKHFYVEPHDHDLISHPDSEIIDKGGFVLLARLDGKIIGTAALIVSENNQLELSKMSVDEDYQGLGIGEKLARAAINQFRATDFKTLYLESSRKLLPALNLCHKLGFVEKPSPFESAHYDRADIYMEFDETA